MRHRDLALLGGGVAPQRVSRFSRFKTHNNGLVAEE